MRAGKWSQKSRWEMGVERPCREVELCQPLNWSDDRSRDPGNQMKYYEKKRVPEKANRPVQGIVNS